MLRELLNDAPESVALAGVAVAAPLGTRGFAREVHAVLARAREKGLDGAALRALGEAEDVPEFVAAGLFLDQYLTNLDSQGATDYADLIRRATIEAEAHRDELRARFRHVFVDEYQDTDPGQVALLRALAGDGRDLTVVGDPHQSIYGFRGADVRGILEFPAEFPRADGAPGRRGRAAHHPPVRAAAAASPRSGSPTGSPLPGSIPPRRGPRSSSRSPTPAAWATAASWCGPSTPSAPRPSTSPTCCAAPTSRTASRWDDMAVLVRSGRTSIPPLRRALGAAGVPVEVASDEVPLVRDPAVLPLLDALRAVINLDNDDVEHVDHIDAVPGRGAAAQPAGRPRRRRPAPLRPPAAGPREGRQQGRGPPAAHVPRADPPRRRRARLPRRPRRSRGGPGPRR